MADKRTHFLVVELEGDAAFGWESALDGYLDRWPDDLRTVEGGPGSVGASTAVDFMPPSAADPSR